MKCDECKGTGKHPPTPDHDWDDDECHYCEGTGELCDHCGSSEGECNCGPFVAMVEAIIDEVMAAAGDRAKVEKAVWGAIDLGQDTPTYDVA